MKNMTQLIIGGLAILGIGTVSYRTYKLRKLENQNQAQNVIEIEVESNDDSRK